MAWSETKGIRTLNSVEEFKDAYAEEGSRVWIDLQDPNKELLDELGETLGLHPLVTEDILEQNQRAKVEITGDVLHVVLFALTYEGEVNAHEIDIVAGRRFVLTAHGVGVDFRTNSFVRRDPGAHLAGGTDYLLWLIADWVVDGYFPVFDHLGDEIDELEIDVIHRPNKWVVERLFTVRRDLLQIRHAVNPQREIFNQMTNRDLVLIKPERFVYFRDVYDHLIRLTDELDSYRELVSTTLDIYLSQVNNNLSETVKKLTVATVILAGVGALAGIFGMSEAGLAISFEDLRFWIVTAAIGTVALVGFVYFKRTGWI